MTGPRPAGRPWTLYGRRYAAQASNFGNEAAADRPKDETLHRSHPIANFLFKKAPKAASAEMLLICRFDNSPPWGIRLTLACELRNTSDRQVELG
jgi:hypothetical protein